MIPSFNLKLKSRVVNLGGDFGIFAWMFLLYSCKAPTTVKTDVIRDGYKYLMYTIKPHAPIRHHTV